MSLNRLYKEPRGEGRNSNGVSRNLCTKNQLCARMVRSIYPSQRGALISWKHHFFQLCIFFLYKLQAALKDYTIFNNMIYLGFMFIVPILSLFWLFSKTTILVITMVIGPIIIIGKFYQHQQTKQDSTCLIILSYIVKSRGFQILKSKIWLGIYTIIDY